LELLGLGEFEVELALDLLPEPPLRLLVERLAAVFGLPSGGSGRAVGRGGPAARRRRFVDNQRQAGLLLVLQEHIAAHLVGVCRVVSCAVCAVCAVGSETRTMPVAEMRAETKHGRK
jgi:hypothetical protein